MWDFRVGEVVRGLLSDPEVRMHYLSKAHRTTGDDMTFWGSEQFRQLNADCAGVFDDELLHAVLVSIGGDGVNIQNWGSRTATVIGLKLEDLPPHLVQKGLAVAPLFIIEGPKEPAVLQNVYKLVVDFFAKHAPSTDGVRALPALRFPNSLLLRATAVACFCTPQ